MDTRNKESLDKLIWNFCNAITHEDDWRVRRYIIECKEKGADINISDSQGKTPLMNSIIGGSKSYIADILSMPELNPNMTDKNDNTALMFAVMAKDKETVGLLLKRKDIDVNFKNKEGNTALLLSVEADTSVTELLANFPNIDLNATDKNGITALIKASMKRKDGFDGYYTAKHLVSLDGVDVNAQDNDGNSALHYSAPEFWGHVFADLVHHRNININSLNKKDESPLILAIKGSSFKNIKSLISQNEINFNYIDKQGRSAVMWLASHSQDNELEKQLINLSGDFINVNALDQTGYTALMWAIRERRYDWELKNFLESPDLEINQTDYEGNSALNLAAQFNKYDMAAMILLNNNVDINFPNEKNETPILWAVRNNNNELFNFLISLEDIDVDIITEDGETLLHSAVKQGSAVMVAEILKKSQKHLNHVNHLGDSPIIEAVRNNFTDISIHLLSFKNIDLNSKDRNGNTALMIAAEKNYLNLVIRILGKNATEINTENNVGEIALSIAARHGYFEITFVILNIYSLAEISDDLNSVAEIASQNGHKEVANLIQDRLQLLNPQSPVEEKPAPSEKSIFKNLGVFDPKPEIKVSDVQSNKSDSDNELDSPYMIINNT